MTPSPEDFSFYEEASAEFSRLRISRLLWTSVINQLNQEVVDGFLGYLQSTIDDAVQCSWVLTAEEERLLSTIRDVFSQSNATTSFSALEPNHRAAAAWITELLVDPIAEQAWKSIVSKLPDPSLSVALSIFLNNISSMGDVSIPNDVLTLLRALEVEGDDENINRSVLLFGLSRSLLDHFITRQAAAGRRIVVFQLMPLWLQAMYQAQYPLRPGEQVLLALDTLDRILWKVRSLEAINQSLKDPSYAQYITEARSYISQVWNLLGAQIKAGGNEHQHDLVKELKDYNFMLQDLLNQH